MATGKGEKRAEKVKAARAEQPSPAEGPLHQTLINIVSAAAALGALGASFTQLVQTPFRSRLLVTFIFSMIGSLGLMNWRWGKQVNAGKLTKGRAVLILVGRIA